MSDRFDITTGACVISGFVGDHDLKMVPAFVVFSQDSDLVIIGQHGEGSGAITFAQFANITVEDLICLGWNLISGSNMIEWIAKFAQRVRESRTQTALGHQALIETT